MAKRKRKEEKVEEAAPPPKVEETPEPSVSTRNLERPRGSIRIVRGRKDAKQ